MDIRGRLFPFLNTPKYDIYEQRSKSHDENLSHEMEELDDDHLARKSWFKFKATKKAKSIYHSTPLDGSFFGGLKFPCSSITTISRHSVSSSATRIQFSRSLEIEKTPNRRTSVKHTSSNSSSFFHPRLRATHNRTPKSSWTATTSRSRSAPTSKSSTSGGRTHSLSKTPGSIISLTNDVPPSTIVALVEGRGQARREIGMATIDLHRPQMTVAQFWDTHTYTHTLTKLTILNPLEILFASTAEDERLMKVVQESIKGVTITSVHRKYFNETRGLAILRHLATPQCSQLESQISSKYYCLSAVAALIRYVEQIQNVTYAPHTLMVTLASSERTLTIDHYSSKNLELVRNLSKGWEGSLFGSIRYTCTASGTRMLRASLLQPFADLQIIEMRLGALEYLTQHPDLFYSLKAILHRFPDLDWLLSMCVQQHKEDTEVRIEQRMNYVIGLKNTLELLSTLKMALETTENPLFVSIKKSISGGEIETLLNILRHVLHEDARLLKGSTAMRTQRCYAIKSNINSLLDVARKIYSEIVDDITIHVEALSSACNIPMRIGHNTSRGFHIIIPLAKKSPKPKLPMCFLQVQRNRGCVTCTTEEIYQLDQRSRESLKEILIMSNVIILELMSEIQRRAAVLFGVAEAVATLDMVVGLAHAASLGSWTQPTFSTHLAIREGRHPILDLVSTDPLVPNNTFLNQEKRVMVISGPNMSGKSTYLKQVALIQVLAQIGSYVPAKEASLKLVKHLFTLLGNEDSPENSSSNFQVQMNEVSAALQMTNSQSLILLDELGQGTNIDEGTSLAWATMEGFLSKKGFLILATHIWTLTRLPELYPQVTNFYMESALRDDKKLHLSYVLRKGVNDAKNYGLSLAVSTPLPKGVISRAYQTAAEMEKLEEEKEGTHSPTSVPIDDKVYLLAHRLLAFAAAVPSTSFDLHDTSEDAKVPTGTSQKEEEPLKLLLKNMLGEFFTMQRSQ